MKYTKLERNWVMYDVSNSALVLLNTSVVPIYFNAINTGASSADLVVAWGNAQTIASLVIAMLMPVLGALADYAGNKIKFFMGFFLTGLVLCFAQAIPMSAMAFLTVYVLCTIGLNSSMTFYDAMLPDITTDERMDAVSSSGFAWGYIGSTVPFIVCLALIMGGPALGIPPCWRRACRLSSPVPGGSSLPCHSSAPISKSTVASVVPRTVSVTLWVVCSPRSGIPCARSPATRPSFCI